MRTTDPLPEPWASVGERLRRRGLRWTPQREAVISVLADAQGHVTGAELVERCRAVDPGTTPSTVYRTLDVLEDLGLVRHGHGADGREEYPVGPASDHGHLYCESCGGRWEIGADQAAGMVAALRATSDFEVDLSHVTVVGRSPPSPAAHPRGEEYNMGKPGAA
jgi:Fur family transcriptional regulator, ferric uptake regulator